MTDVPGIALTAGALLYSDDVVAGLAARIADPETQAAIRRRVGSVGATALDVVERDLADVTAGFLRVNLATVIAAGWSKHRQLVAAGTRTLGPPPAEPEELVALLSHDIALTQHPTVDVLVNGQTAFTLSFELAVNITVSALNAVVRRGWLVGLGTGRCTVKVVFSLQGSELGSAELPLDLHMLLPLGKGIPLVVPQPRAAIPAPPMMHDGP